jgi:hypothetical protein
VGGVAASSKGLVDVDKNHKSPRGSKGLTSGNKRLIRNAVHLLGDAFDVEDLTLFTGTLPGESREDCITALEIWPELTRQFLQEIKRELERAGLPPFFAGCTEIQPERYEATGQPWPHIHLCFPSRVDGSWVITGKRIKFLWAKIAARLTGREIFEFQPSGRVDQCHDRKKLGRYLSKYMSKGSNPDVLSVLNDEDYPRVASWKHCSAQLKAAVEGCTSKLTSTTARRLYAIAARSDEGCEVWVAIQDPYAQDDLALRPLGFVGTLTPELIAALLLEDDRERQTMEAA